MPVHILILAAGEGKRMGGSLPKALSRVAGRPLLIHLLDSVSRVKCEKEIFIIVSPKHAGKIQKAVGQEFHFIQQDKPLGTAHAVMSGKGHLGDAATLMVLYADQPFIQTPTLEKILQIHRDHDNTITFATFMVKGFSGWEKPFEEYGRILRRNGRVAGIRELKDLNEAERNIFELNSGYYCFHNAWLWQNIEKLDNNNLSKEYYLTDLVELAFEQKKRVEPVDISSHEAFGVNTPEALAQAQIIVKKYFV